MKQIRLLFVSIGVSFVVLLAAQAGFAQAIEPNYEIALQMVVGSNEGGRSTLPANLNSVTQQLAPRFGLSNYRLAGTMVGRITTSGTFEYRSVSPLFSQSADNRGVSFVEWTLSGLRNGSGTKGNQFAFESFRFGARVPVAVATTKDQTGKEQSIYNNEQIGVTSKRFAIPENSPTVVASLSVPGGTDTVFLVMTVRPVEL